MEHTMSIAKPALLMLDVHRLEQFVFMQHAEQIVVLRGALLLNIAEARVA
jgi:hypothetical protein